MKVLIVDDEPDILDILEFLFQEIEFEVIRTNNPLVAIEYLWEHSFTIMVTDYCMPNVSGAQLCNSSRLSNPNCVNIILSGTEYIEKLQQYSIDHIVKKPFSWTILNKIVMDSLSQKEIK